MMLIGTRIDPEHQYRSKAGFVAPAAGEGAFGSVAGASSAPSSSRNSVLERCRSVAEAGSGALQRSGALHVNRRLQFIFSLCLFLLLLKFYTFYEQAK